MPLFEQVLAQLNLLEAEKLLLPDAKAKLIVGVSGGPDSLALLHLLKEIYGPDRLVVAHLQHGLRAAADAEARFVAQTAAAWGIACYVEGMDVLRLARQEGWSLEEAGRKARYQFFGRLADKVNARIVAVGHNADDQAETVLMHFLRGTGLAGLRGMLPASPLPGSPSTTLLRPFLKISRAEIEAYCRKHDLQPVEDYSNEDITFFRNRLRHQLLPFLTDYNPQIRLRLQQMAAIVAADHELLDHIAEEQWPAVVEESSADWLSLDRSAWLALPLSLRRLLLRQAIERLRPSLRNIGFRPIEQARQVAEKGHTGAQTMLPGGLTLTVEYERLLIKADATTIGVSLPQLHVETPLGLSVPGYVKLAAPWTISAIPVREIDLAQIKNNRDPWVAFIDMANVDKLQVRPRRSGERFQPLGMRGQSAKVTDVMINRKIGASLRMKWPLVANQSHVVWLVGHHIDERVKVTTKSRQVVQLSCRSPLSAE